MKTFGPISPMRREVFTLRWMYLCALLSLLSLPPLVVTLPSSAHAEPSITPGFTTLGIWEPETKLRLDVALWYPSTKASFEVRYDNWTFMAARSARPLEGRHPLVVLSHDSTGSRFSLHMLAASLAESGFVVAAPTHAGDNVDDMSRLFTVEQLATRAKDLSELISFLITSPKTEELIDASRIGVLGVGPGGTVALLLAGGRLDANGWPGYCATASAQDPYCTPWAASRMLNLATTPNLGKKFRDPRVRVAASVAPAYGMLFSKASLAKIRVPLLLLRADLDTINRAPHHADAIRQVLPQPPVFDVLNNTDGAALMAPCASTFAQTLPEMCTSSTPGRRLRAQEQLATQAVTFFLNTLGSNSLPPPLPEPPDDLPPKVKNPEPSPAPKATKGSRSKSARR